MKRIFVLSFSLMFASILMFSCEQKKTSGEKQLSTEVVTSPDGENMPVIEFDKEVHNFGRIVSGEKVSYSFKYKNTGKSALVISEVKSGCGCTVGEYSKEPIAPGDGGVITVTFNSAHRQGAQTQNIRVLANTNPNVHVLRITSEVVEP
ncbi:MAG: DUF1573 domain-containing protein [Bacteroidales bacterium]|nr:DUF1573 domain-containing protein [Bacteroidales bacterium]